MDLMEALKTAGVYRFVDVLGDWLLVTKDLTPWLYIDEIPELSIANKKDLEDIEMDVQEVKSDLGFRWWMRDIWRNTYR